MRRHPKSGERRRRRPLELHSGQRQVLAHGGPLRERPVHLVGVEEHLLDRVHVVLPILARDEQHRWGHVASSLGRERVVEALGFMEFQARRLFSSRRPTCT